MTRKGIDVSHWQGTIDWNKVKKAGIEFAIIKAGGSDAGFYTDSKWEAKSEISKRYKKIEATDVFGKLFGAQ